MNTNSVIDQAYRAELVQRQYQRDVLAFQALLIYLARLNGLKRYSLITFEWW